MEMSFYNQFNLHYKWRETKNNNTIHVCNMNTESSKGIKHRRLFTWLQQRILKSRVNTQDNVCCSEVYLLVTDFVPSEMACFDNSPGRINLTEVWISREEIVDFFEYDASSKQTLTSASITSPSDRQHILEASVAIRSKISFTNELRMAIALLEIPVSGCTCLSTRPSRVSNTHTP